MGCKIENVPIQSDGIVPKDELIHTLCKRISKKKIEELAIQKYKTCGNGSVFLNAEYHDSKHQEGGRING
jgi:hypothetical protein